MRDNVVMCLNDQKADLLKKAFFTKGCSSMNRAKVYCKQANQLSMGLFSQVSREGAVGSERERERERDVWVSHKALAL